MTRITAVIDRVWSQAAALPAPSSHLLMAHTKGAALCRWRPAKGYSRQHPQIMDTENKDLEANCATQLGCRKYTKARDHLETKQAGVCD